VNNYIERIYAARALVQPPRLTTSHLPGMTVKPYLTPPVRTKSLSMVSRRTSVLRRAKNVGGKFTSMAWGRRLSPSGRSILTRTGSL
jgi:hypothetical protein